jgi:hypothetical protein
MIHLSNPDLTYIKNPERNKIMLMPFHLLKTYIMTDNNHDRREEFCKISIFAKLLETNFSCFAKIGYGCIHAYVCVLKENQRGKNHVGPAGQLDPPGVSGPHRMVIFTRVASSW